MIHEVIILGSGPAGCTAAIYLSRAGFPPLIIEGPKPGGELISAPFIENFPAFPEGIEGPKLAELLRKHAKNLGSKLIQEEAISVDLSSIPFRITTEKNSYLSKSIIIATGSKRKMLGVEGEKEFLGKGLSLCATCDAPLFKKKEVVVVGGGDVALEEALYLARFCSKVTLIHRRDKFRASKVLSARAVKEPKIAFKLDSIVTKIEDLSQKSIKAVKVKNVKNQKEDTIPCEGVFIAVGFSPNTSIFRGKLELDEDGYIKLFGNTSTSVNGVFACGDVIDKVYRQAVTAAAGGCMAAHDCQKFLSSYNT
jgi:thioredoxin reductase (NADPH)